MRLLRAGAGYLPIAPAPGNRLRLFCFHHAGGGASTFGHCKSALSAVDVVPVQLPGREGRISEPRVVDMTVLVRELIENIGAELRPPYAFYGHSMGALVSFNLAHAVQELGMPLPEFLAVGAYPGPDRIGFMGEVPGLTEPELARLLVRIGGMSETLLDYPEWRDAANSLVRADLRLCHSYQHSGQVIDCPVHAFAGRRDPLMQASEARAWSGSTRGAFELHLLSGGHFFIRESQAEFLRLLSAVIAGYHGQDLIHEEANGQSVG
jgi:surfactin synthase thioesterase subunit